MLTTGGHNYAQPKVLEEIFRVTCDATPQEEVLEGT
jgi:hypothetical protein